MYAQHLFCVVQDHTRPEHAEQCSCQDVTSRPADSDLHARICGEACLAVIRVFSIVSLHSSYQHCMQEGWTALHFAAMSGLEDMVELMMSKGLSVNAKTKVCKCYQVRTDQ
jgi:hypothetical protein